MREHGLEDQAVEIVGMAMHTDFPSSFEANSDMSFVGFDMSKAAAQDVYEQSGLGPEDVDVIELHDCFSANELITYEALGLCDEGGGGELIDSGAVTYGGDVVVNPSGGLISKGHPLGATGLAQCAELNWQLRGTGRRPSGRRTPSSRCSTTSASAAPASSPCTRRPPSRRSAARFGESSTRQGVSTLPETSLGLRRWWRCRRRRGGSRR